MSGANTPPTKQWTFLKDNNVFEVRTCILLTLLIAMNVWYSVFDNKMIAICEKASEKDRKDAKLIAVLRTASKSL